MNRVHGTQRLGGDLGIGHADAEDFFHAYHQLERIDGIKAQPARPEERKVVPDLFSRRLEHQILDQHFLDALAEIGVGHGY